MQELPRRFAIVGPGRVGHALGLALAARGLVPVGVWGRAVPVAAPDLVPSGREGRPGGEGRPAGERAASATPAPGERLARLASELNTRARTTPTPELREADWLFLTVPDRELAAVAQLFHQSGLVRPDAVWIHTAGVYGVEVLPAGRPRLALHPAASISGKPEEVEGLTWAVEVAEAGRETPDFARLTENTNAAGPAGPARPAGEAGKAAAEIVALLGGRMVLVPGERRAFYHAATALAANLSAAVWLLAEDMLKAAGFSPDDAHQTVMRLARSSLANVEQAGAAGVTGPVRRGDLETVQRHLQALAAFDAPSASGRPTGCTSGGTSSRPSGRSFAVNAAGLYRRLSFLLACELANHGLLTPADVLEWERVLSTGDTPSTGDQANGTRQNRS